MLLRTISAMERQEGSGSCRRTSDRQPIDWALFLAFALWNAWRVFDHVAWRDELQAFLIARESGGPLSLFQNLSHEAHPGLWHLILLAAIRIWDSPVVLQLIQAAVAVATTALIWLASPFTRVERLLLALGYYLAFEYVVFARGYGLGVVLLFCFVVARRSPWAWLVLGLMANISVHFLALAGICGGLLLCWGQRSRTGLLVFAALAAIATLTILPAPDTLSPREQPPALVALPAAIMRMSAAFFPFDFLDPSRAYWGMFCRSCGGAALLPMGLLVPIAGVVSLRRHKTLAAAYLLLCIALIAIGTFAYLGSDRHYGVALIMLIGLHWIAREQGARRSRTFDALIGLSALTGVWSVAWSLPVDFSGGRAVADWLERNAPQDSVLAAYPGWMGTDVSAYAGIPSFNLQAQRYQTFVVWNYAADDRASDTQLASWLRAAPRSGPLYLIVDPDYTRLHMVLSLAKRGIRLVQMVSVEEPVFQLRVYRVLFDAEPSRS